MKNSLTGIGMRVVNHAFGGLLAMITLKMTEYWAAIEVCDTQIALMKAEQVKARAEIKARNALNDIIS